MADIYPAELGKLLDKFGLHPGVETFIARLPQDRLIRLVLAMERCSNNTELASSIAGLLVSSLSEDASGARALNEIWLEAFVTEETDPRHPAVDQAIRTLIGQWVIVHGYHPMELGGGGSCGAKRDEAVRNIELSLGEMVRRLSTTTDGPIGSSVFVPLDDLQDQILRFFLRLEETGDAWGHERRSDPVREKFREHVLDLCKVFEQSLIEKLWEEMVETSAGRVLEKGLIRRWEPMTVVQTVIAHRSCRPVSA